MTNRLLRGLIAAALLFVVHPASAQTTGGAAQALVWQLKAQRLLARAEAAQAAGPARFGALMASPPTITTTDVGANATLDATKTTASPTYTMASGVFAVTGGKLVQRTGTRYHPAGVNSTGVNSPFGWCVTFATDAPAFEIPVYAQNATNRANLRLRVDGLWATSGYTITNTLSNWTYTYTKVDFGSRATRVIDVCADDETDWTGVTVDAASRVWKPPISEPAVLMRGSSTMWGQVGAMSLRTQARNNAPARALEALGIRYAINAGRGGTGLISTNYGTDENLGQRDAELTAFGPLDLIIEGGSTGNDMSATGYTNAALTAAMTTELNAVHAAQPNALVIIFGNIGGVNGSPQSYFDSLKAGYDVAKVPGRDCYVDNSPNAGQFLDTVNSSTYSPDGTHGSDPAGQIYIGARWQQSILDCLRQLAN